MVKSQPANHADPETLCCSILIRSMAGSPTTATTAMIEDRPAAFDQRERRRVGITLRRHRLTQLTHRTHLIAERHGDAFIAAPPTSGSSTLDTPLDALRDSLSIQTAS